ncbi:MutS-related protein [Clostridium sp. 'White wine YQ']|uniref:MutS-related protein n=1 Tax=Clostridium sp. 'White wine YQ' TaxID=3027474 RepID=UPI00236512E9|nr:DNA mismatch repair protein MutS [Clostridium sp. 'White wine YQ']MDD7794904.1 DNA mismatch repair protein MutS [Clostridium sp. 'White wine YQ']
MSSQKIYEGNIEKINEKIDEVNSSINRIALIRGIIFILFGISVYYIIKQKGFAFILASLLLILVFVFIAYIHTKEKEKLKEFNLLIDINNEHIKRAKGEWKEFNDKGEEYLSSEHPFINDLDIFGDNSLFQWINTTKTFYGREKLAEILSSTETGTAEEISKRQKSLKELAAKIDFRQRLEFIPLLRKSPIEKTKNFISWVKEENSWFLSSQANLIRFIMPIISIVILGSVIIFKKPVSLFLLALIVNGAILTLKKKEIGRALEEIYSFKTNLSSYYKMIAAIENEDFKEEINLNVVGILKGNVMASNEMKEITSIGDMLFDRGNMIYWIFNSLLMWDFVLMAKLERWKLKNKNSVELWLDALGEVEALSALSNIYFDNENWSIPEIIEEDEIVAEDLAHPLIVPQGIKNSFNLTKPIQTALITGSNMSGKSTFLRTIGINMVFSYLGLPVNGRKLKLGVMIPYTCMRTKDNLEEGISSFYAEILRVKNIIRATESEKKVFYLLDEIFKGTNSVDRHTGAEMLIKQLMGKGAKGLVSTHDLELCELEQEDRRIKNLHFREYYVDNEIRFDYKLREGKSTTRNAEYLMKMAGIRLDN